MQTELLIFSEGQLQEAQAAAKELALYKAEVERLRNRVICTKKDQDAIQRRGKVRMVELLGAPESEGYKYNRRRAFSMFWRGYKRNFGIKSYRDTLEKDYDSAIRFIDHWQPDNPELLQPPKMCLLCEEEPGELEVDDGKICYTCAQIMGEMAPE